MQVDRETLKQSMSRIAILSNEKYRGIRLTLSSGNLSIQANNPDQEEAEEELQVDYDESDMEIGFNVTYLIDVLNVLGSDKVQIKLKDSNSSAIMSDQQDESSLYVVMPMRCRYRGALYGNPSAQPDGFQKPAQYDARISTRIQPDCG